MLRSRPGDSITTLLLIATNVKMSCCDLITWKGTTLVVPVMTTIWLAVMYTVVCENPGFIGLFCTNVCCSLHSPNLPGANIVAFCDSLWMSFPSLGYIWINARRKVCSSSNVSFSTTLTDWKMWTHWDKWPPFSRRHFQMHFLEWKCVHFD